MQRVESQHAPHTKKEEEKKKKSLASKSAVADQEGNRLNPHPPTPFLKN